MQGCLGFGEEVIAAHSVENRVNVEIFDVPPIFLRDTSKRREGPGQDLRASSSGFRARCSVKTFAKEPAVKVVCAHLGVVNDTVRSKLRDEWYAPGAAGCRNPRAASLGKLNGHLTHSARTAKHQDSRTGFYGCTIEA
jgi:hypothetical protein